MGKYFTFLVFAIFISIPNVFGQNWNALGTGMNDDVYALCEYNGELYAGGKFTTADGNPANHIAKWDGSGWVSVDYGLNGSVWALTVFNGELYAGGFFNNYGFGMARWNGISWQGVGGGMNGGVYAFCVYNGKLFVGGKFSIIGSMPAYHIAQWDGVSWDTLGSGTTGLNPWVLALTTYNGKLIVGGEFTSAGGFPSHYVSSWNDTTWIPMGPTTTTETYPMGICALCSYNNKLYAGGYLDTIGLTHVTNNMGEWDGTNWNSFGLNLNAYVYAMTTDNNKLFVGGYFTSPGAHITAWNGTIYSNFGTGMNDFVSTLTFYNGHLYAGGRFTNAGSIVAKRVAWWSTPLAVTEYSDQNGVDVFPNPNEGNMTFVFSGNKNQDRKLEFYNSIGQLVDAITIEDGQEQIILDECKLENGIYLFHLMSNGEVLESGKFVIVK